MFSHPEYSAKVYAFAYTINGVQKKFGISTYGHLNFSSYDKFSLEFAGYADRANTVKLWMIRRTDGKYLTAGLEYKDKLTGSAATAARIPVGFIGQWSI
jgi:hypothetical protein